jgi:hypothetical protein
MGNSPFEISDGKTFMRIIVNKFDKIHASHLSDTKRAGYSFNQTWPTLSKTPIR